MARKKVRAQKGEFCRLEAFKDLFSRVPPECGGGGGGNSNPALKYPEARANRHTNKLIP